MMAVVSDWLRLRRSLGWLLGVALLPLCGSAAMAQSQADLEKLFTGSTITIIGSNAGSGADILIRASAEILGDFLPGKPARIVVQNIPGGGGIPQVRRFMQAKPDGLTITVLHSRHTVDALFGTHDIKEWDPRKTGIIGSPTGGGQSRLLCVNPQTYKWTGWKDLITSGKKLNVAASEPSGGAAAMAVRFIEMNNGPMKIITGYSGVNDIFAAYLRGEVPVLQHCPERSLKKEYADLLKTPEEAREKFIPILWWDIESDPEWLKTLGYDGKVPHVNDVLDLMGAGEEQKTAFRAALEIRSVFSRMWTLPVGTPEPIVKAWQDAFMNMTASQKYKDLMVKIGFEDEYGPRSAQQLRDAFKLFDSLSPQSVAVIKQLGDD
jgi:tripartite-type tricarboxylate transporter receptor subunit TctC